MNECEFKSCHNYVYYSKNQEWEFAFYKMMFGANMIELTLSLINSVNHSPVYLFA